MNTHRLVGGLHILMKYDPTGKDEVQNGHDVLYLGGPPPQDMAPDDVSALERLNFFWDEDEETWTVFT